MCSLIPRPHVSLDAYNLLQRRNQSTRGKDCLNLRFLLLDRGMTIASDDNEPVYVAKEERIFPFWVPVLLPRVPEANSCIDSLAKFERV